MTLTPPPAEAGTPPEGDGKPIETRAHTPEETDKLIRKLREENKARRLEAETLAAELMDRKQKEAELEQEWLKEQGEYKTLYEKQAAEAQALKQQAEKAAAFEKAFQDNLNARIAQIPEGMRSMVPEGLDPIKLSEYLDKNAAFFQARKAPNLDAGAGSAASTAKPVQLTAEEMEIARQMRMTPEMYAQFKRSAGT